MGNNSLSKIGSLLAVLICIDECTTKVLKVSFARILIEMDVTKEVPRELNIEDPSGSMFTQKVIYDWLPAFSNKCELIGHNCEKALPRKPAKQVQKNGFLRFLLQLLWSLLILVILL